MIYFHDKTFLQHLRHLNFNTYNKIDGAIRRHFGKQMNKETKLRIHNITAKAALKFGSEVLGTEEKRGTTFRSSTDEIFETLTWNNKTRQRKESMY